MYRAPQLRFRRRRALQIGRRGSISTAQAVDRPTLDICGTKPFVEDDGATIA